MATDSIVLEWNENMSFSSHVNGHIINIDASEEFGGQNLGPRPKPLMMVALAGCTGMDVISILRKMRIYPDSFQVKIESVLTEDHPKHYTAMKVIYLLTGNNIPPDKVKRAVQLSEEQYCGVSAVYRKAMELSFEIIINGEITA